MWQTAPVLRRARDVLGTRQAVAVLAAALLATTALALVAGGVEPDEQVEAQGTDEFASTPSTEDERVSTTTSSTTTTVATTAAPTTTVAATTTAAPPPTAAPTTATPPPPPPPPSEGGSLDIGAVVAFAKQHHSGAAIPRTTTGSYTCPEGQDRPSDAGDDTARDISDWYLIRYCNDIYRLVVATDDEAPLDYFWLQADVGPGGCGGIDRVALAWERPSGQSIERVGDVVATPGCDAGSWQVLDSVGAPVWNCCFLQLDFRGSALGASGSFRWQAFVQADGESIAHADFVPNAGPERFTIG